MAKIRLLSQWERNDAFAVLDTDEETASELIRLRIAIPTDINERIIVTRFIQELPGTSDKIISKIVGADRKLVAEIRKELKT